MTNRQPTASRALLLIGIAPLLPTLIGSLVNIWYNATQIEPLLTPAQHALFVRIVIVFNLVIYPPFVAIWAAVLLSLRAPLRAFAAGEALPPGIAARARRRVINLPWWAVGLCGPGWLLCIPAFLITLGQAAEPLDARIYAHLPISFLISGMIATTHAFFGIELLTQRLLFPVVFATERAWMVPGTAALSLRARGLLWAISAGVCPIASLMLLALVPQPETPAFVAAVGGLGIAFGLVTAWLVGRVVTEPIHELRRAAQAVGGGDLGVRVDLARADEFGPLIDEFNGMVAGLREKARVEENFGRHVGHAVARRIMERDRDLGGIVEQVTVMFVDIRDFTARSSRSTPQDIVALLNLFLGEMVDVVEQRHGGIVNKFLGDGLMALYWEGSGRADHADAAVAAGCEMFARLDRINETLAKRGTPPIAIGIGIHTGPAVIGSIGSPHRMEFTAIGDTVNVASRVESLTKVVGAPLLLTEATREALRKPLALEALLAQPVKGQAEPIAIYRLA
jgi:adenylate cyclase